MQKRTAEKLTAEVRAIARDLAAKLAALPADADLADVELSLRDTVASLRRASIEITDVACNANAEVAS